MLNKTIAVLGAAAVLLGTTIPAFALVLPALDLNLALIHSDTASVANTGANVQASMAEIRKADVDDVKVAADNRMKTGHAIATAENSVEANKISNQTYNDHTGITFNGAFVGLSTQSLANSGENEQLGTLLIKKADADNVEVWGKGDMETGGATSTAKSWTVVNTTWNGLALE